MSPCCVVSINTMYQYGLRVNDPVGGPGTPITSCTDGPDQETLLPSLTHRLQRKGEKSLAMQNVRMEEKNRAS